MEYEEALEIIKNELSFTSGVIEEALDLIENCVSKQMPKAVVYNIFKSNGWGNVECKCPICDSVLAGENWVAKHYCDNCGQALDWSDSK